MRPFELLLPLGVASVWRWRGAGGVAIDNGVVGSPEVECGANSVEMMFRAERRFFGKIFVKGHYSEPDCRVDFGGQPAADDDEGRPAPVAGIKLFHGTCGMSRQRSLQPKGMEFTAVVVISFHPLFITKIDRAYHVKCFYREQEKTVTANMEVSMLTTTSLSHAAPMPVCTYTIRKDEIDGEILRYARVGDQVVHRWECQSEQYGMLVHSCFVEDGRSDKIMVIDERGCHQDQYLLGDPTYVRDLNMAYRESHVFKFADRVSVRFQCQIRLCLKANGGCDDITPPVCVNGKVAGRNERRPKDELPEEYYGQKLDEGIMEQLSADNETDVKPPSRSRRLASRTKRSTATKKDQKAMVVNDDFEPIDGDFMSQYIYVLDTTETPELATLDDGSRSSLLAAQRQFHGAVAGLNPSSTNGGTVCLSSVALGTLVASVLLVALGAAGVLLVLGTAAAGRVPSVCGAVFCADAAMGCDKRCKRDDAPVVVGSLALADNAPNRWK